MFQVTNSKYSDTKPNKNTTKKSIANASYLLINN